MSDTINDEMPDSLPNVFGMIHLGVTSVDDAARISRELLPAGLGRFWRADDYGELEAEILESVE
jgi:hypothetical protein